LLGSKDTAPSTSAALSVRLLPAKMSVKKTFLQSELTDVGMLSIAIGVHQQIIVTV
jgi:hypothetical protein